MSNVILPQFYDFMITSKGHYFQAAPIPGTNSLMLYMSGQQFMQVYWNGIMGQLQLDPQDEDVAEKELCLRNHFPVGALEWFLTTLDMQNDVLDFGVEEPDIPFMLRG